MKIGFVLFEDYWQRKGIGSSRIRGTWVIKYLNRIKGVEAESFVQGAKYDVVIFQKAYWKEMAKDFKGIKVLDICDPDWLDGADVVGFLKHMDFITVPTEAMQQAVGQFTDKPVYIIPDGEDLEMLPAPKIHEGKAKKVLWFGYSHNLDVIYPAFYNIKKLGLTLVAVTDGILNTAECHVENVRWKEETCDEEYQKCDFAILPDKTNGRFKFKSNNKTIHAWALGLPVAKNPKDMERFMDADQRNEEAKLRYAEVRANYSVAKSAEKLYNYIKAVEKTNV